jgi:hypothetical protein
MPLFREQGMTFIHIPKTAGTSIELALGLDLDPAIENPDVCFGRLASPDLMKLELSSQFLQHLRLGEVEKLHPDFVRDSWVFTVVRDPWARLVSSFRRKDRAMADFAKWYYGLDLYALDFEQYVEIAASHDLLHLRPQSSFLQGSAKVNVFYFEHLSDLMQVLSERLGRTLALPKANGPESTLKRLSSRKERKLRARVAEIYAEDYRRFYPGHKPMEPDSMTSLLTQTFRSRLARVFGSP